jgi:hypothetical protein
MTIKMLHIGFIFLSVLESSFQKNLFGIKKKLDKDSEDVIIIVFVFDIKINYC